MSIIITGETRNVIFTEGSSETGLVSPFLQTISDVTTVGTEPGTAIRAFQISIFIEGTPIPNARGLKLKRNIIAEVLYTRDGILIRAGDVDEEGYGVTLEEASFDFLTSLRDRYNSLRRRKARLSENELSVLNNLRRALH